MVEVLFFITISWKTIIWFHRDHCILNSFYLLIFSLDQCNVISSMGVRTLPFYDVKHMSRFTKELTQSLILWTVLWLYHGKEKCTWWGTRRLIVVHVRNNTIIKK